MRGKLNRKAERKLEQYRGADRSVTLSGVIAPPTKNAAKTAFAAQKPRLDPTIKIPTVGRVVHVPSKFGL